MKQEQLQLTGGNFNDSRRKLDYYPTPRNVTIALLEFLQLPKNRIIWEPACGEGAMSSVFKEYGYTVIETDIIHGQDYLTTLHDADVIITNPPFNLAEAFIKKAVNESRITAMLLKSQFWHAKKRVELFKNTKPSHILPLTWRPDFLEHERTDGKKGSPTMEVAWTVWNKSCNHQTIYQPLTNPTK